MRYLTDTQLDKFADVLINMGTVIFASVIVPFFLQIEKFDERTFYSGLVLTFGFWVDSILIVGRIKK